MKLSFSIEIARQPKAKPVEAVKKDSYLSADLDELFDESAEPSAATLPAPGRRIVIPVIDGNAPVKRTRMSAKRKAALMAESLDARREKANTKRRATRAAKKKAK